VPLDPASRSDDPSRPPFGLAERLLALAVALAVLAMLFVGNRSRPELRFVPFYLLPSAVVAWYAGRPLGLTVGFVAGIAWGLAQEPLAAIADVGVIGWNVAMYVAACMGSAAIAGALRKSVLALEATVAREQELARVDALTGVRNVRAFRELLEPELLRVRRYGRAVTVAFLDADGFKGINDRFGHAVGDRALQLLARTLGASLRRTDVIARLGGDEFGVILTDTGPDDARAVLAKACERVTEAAAAQGWTLTMSVGAVSCVEGIHAVESVIDRADTLMFSVKRGGKNSIRLEVLEGESDTVATGDHQRLR
jgi:diguanylate cyclase (GGDEF)-like protein